MKIIIKILKYLASFFVSLFGILGWLFQGILQLLAIGLIVTVLVAILIYVKVKPDLDYCRQIAYDKLAQMERQDFRMLSDTEIYGKDGQLIGLVNAGHYEYVPISQISLNIQNAYIAQEEKDGMFMYQIDFKKPQKVHFIGIGGISMSGLAEILLREGFTVSGSDAHESPLTERLINQGAKIFYGQRAENIQDGVELVVYTAAIHPDNPEYQEVQRREIPMMSRAELLGQMMKNYHYAAGTHTIISYEDNVWPFLKWRQSPEGGGHNHQ